MVHYIVTGILVRENRILLGLRASGRAFFPNVWDVFGGHIEPGEEPEQTLIRELEEELGITPTQWMKLETLTDSVPNSVDAEPDDLVVYLFCVTDWMGEPSNRQLEEHSVIQWYSYDEAAKLDLAHPSYPELFAQCLRLVKERGK